MDITLYVFIFTLQVVFIFILFAVLAYLGILFIKIKIKTGELKGDTGPAGVPGESAYVSFVKHTGYCGSEEQFNEKLKELIK